MQGENLADFRGFGDALVEFATYFEEMRISFAALPIAGNDDDESVAEKNRYADEDPGHCERGEHSGSIANRRKRYVVFMSVSS